MEIKLHYLPEKPDRTCEVLVFHHSPEAGSIYYATNCEYSNKYGLFNCGEKMTDEGLTKSERYSKSVIAWAYMAEVERGVLDEADGHIHKG